MEVHAHTQTPRKKWTHYFWEFLMLFLAVFCGFLAEYQLEHKIEKERGMKYILSFYEDLQTDTARFSRIIIENERRIQALNNMYNCYDSVMANPKINSCLLGLLKNSMGFTDILHTDRTLQQLKNAGGFRLLNKEDTDSIFWYDNLVRYALSYQTTLQESQTNLRNAAYGLFTFKVIKQLGLQPDSLNIKPEGLILSAAGALPEKYFNELANYLQRTNGQLRYLNRLKLKATNLLIYFQDKYSF